MRLSARWLRELADLEGGDDEAIARDITFHTAEVEGLEPRGTGLDGVETARVAEVRPHPDADRLRLCRVERGDGSVEEVVCGAPNVAAGQVVCYAPVGVTLPGGLTLERRAIRGVESAGMILAEDEMGLGDDHEGIVVLPEGTPLGQPAAEALRATDTIIEVENKALTHRPDLWGHVGFARELAAVRGQRGFSGPEAPAARARLEEAAEAPFPLSIEDEDGCQRYVGLVVEGIRNGPAPDAVRRRLEALGVRSIDLVVDLTNLVLLEQGQPLHAFDLREVRGGRIVVRRAREGERMTTLDEQERALAGDDVVIADAERPLAIAGIMGGHEGEVRADTTAILLESATFDPTRVRRTAARLGLRTEASTRFEKGLDPVAAERGALRFLELLLEVQPDVVVRHALADAWPHPPDPRTIALSYDLVRRRLGSRVTDGRIKSVLQLLGFGVAEAGELLEVEVPTWRATKDVEGPEDLVEEVGRIVGYDRIEPVAPVGRLEPTPLPARRSLLRRLAAILSLELGYAETRTYAFCGPRDVARLGLEDVPHLALAHPYAEDQDRLAQTVAPALLRVVRRNLARESAGRVWEATRLIAPRDPGDDRPLADETPVLGLVAWQREEEATAGRLVLDLMEDLRALLEAVPVGALDVRQTEAPQLAATLPEARWLHPGRAARVDAGGRTIAIVGEVAPAVLRGYELEGRVALAEVSVAALLAAMGDVGATYRPLHRYPVVPFDVAVIVPRRTPADEVVGTLVGAVPEGRVRGARVFDVYEGAGIPQGRRSLAMRCDLLDPEGTLSPEAAERLRGAILSALEAKGWTVRTQDDDAA